LKKAKRTFGWKNAKLITWDVEKETDGIEIIPLWRFLLDYQDGSRNPEGGG